jgi:hypothetical protein
VSAFGERSRPAKAPRACAVLVVAAALTGMFAAAGATALDAPPSQAGSSAAADAGTPASEETGRPICVHVGTRSEGWAWPSGRFIHWAKCKGVVPKCQAVGAGNEHEDHDNTEGWYAADTLIVPADCSASDRKRR